MAILALGLETAPALGSALPDRIAGPRLHPRCCRVCFGLLVAIVLTRGYAQPPGSTASQPATEVITREAPATFRSRTNLVTAPVVVRDSKGRAVGNLEKEDFQLFDNGKPQIVTQFSVEGPDLLEPSPATGEAPHSTGVQPAAAPLRVPQRFVALVIDDLHTDIADLVWAREAAKKFLAPVPSSERLALYTTSGQVGTDFTGDRDELLKALDSIHSLVRPPSDCLQVSYFSADRIRRERCVATEINPVSCPVKAAMAAEAVACDVAGTQEAAEIGGRIQAAAQRALAEGDSNTRRAMDAIRGVIRKLATSPGQRQIVLISDRFLVSDDHRDIESALFEDAIRAHVIVSSLDAGGVRAYVPGGDASQRGVMTTEARRLVQENELIEAQATAAVMDEVASATGGRFFHGNNDMELGLNLLAGVPEFRYVMAFAPQNLKFDGRYHSLKVTLRNSKGLTVEARRGYYAPNRERDPAEQAREEIQAAFFSTEEVHEAPATMEAQFFKSGPDEATVNILARVDVRQLPFRPEDGRNRNDVTVVCGLFDENGNYVSGIQKVVEMRLRDETLATGLASGIVVKSGLKVKPGRYLVRVVVRDSEGQEMTALSGAVEIP